MDIQRTILWVVFSVSVLLLWDNWQRYQGHPSLFFGTPPITEKTILAEKNTAAQGVNNVPMPSVTTHPPVSTATPAVSSQDVPHGVDGVKAPAPAVSQLVRIQTDVLNID